ncbi:hypothetical protein ANN_16085 [Periplaneta americana]|uniref:HTH CENPB-type domain-containing protein n=1 Tax=Periplaneta americana TaxID=6978 RepID=A0ABQ8SI98_PERAM|nr:hypothetical protein ANN_16085 [Periplaneta americana]
MAGLREGGNEPPGSLKANDYKTGKKSEGSVWEVERRKSATRVAISEGVGVNEAARRLTQRSVMQLAYEIAEKNKLATRFNKETKSGGKEWFSGFMKRHPELRLRQPPHHLPGLQDSTGL